MYCYFYDNWSVDICSFIKNTNLSKFVEKYIIKINYGYSILWFIRIFNKLLKVIIYYWLYDNWSIKIYTFMENLLKYRKIYMKIRRNLFVIFTTVHNSSLIN